MSSEQQQTTEAPVEPGETMLCLSCMFPNEPQAHFCAKCGAAASSYAATAPFESIFAEGHAYRRAADQPRKFIVVLGVWLLFGALAAIGAMMLFPGRGRDLSSFNLAGGIFLPVSLVIIWKTTRNYLARPRVEAVIDPSPETTTSE